MSNLNLILDDKLSMLISLSLFHIIILKKGSLVFALQHTLRNIFNRITLQLTCREIINKTPKLRHNELHEELSVNLVEREAQNIEFMKDKTKYIIFAEKKSDIFNTLKKFFEI